MSFIAMFCLSLLIMMTPAQAWTYKGKEKVVNDATNSAYADAYGDNFQKAVAECEQARSVAAGDKYLLGMAEMCAAGVEDVRKQKRAACAHYLRALTLWHDLPSTAEDVERGGKLREWTRLIDTYRKTKCR